MIPFGKPLELLLGYREIGRRQPFSQRFNRSLQRTALPSAELVRWASKGLHNFTHR